MYYQYHLTYSYDSFEPYIDTATVKIHHDKHHATYTNNLNELTQKAGVGDRDIVELLSCLDCINDPELREAIRNNGGGFYNHNMYFEQMGIDSDSLPSGLLGERIFECFGSFDNFKEKMTQAAISQFGSGWAWLSVTPDGQLVISKSSNQDNPISLGTGNIPIFTIDVWEHAYYLQYKNMRANYIKNYWHVVDWTVVEKRFMEAIS